MKHKYLIVPLALLPIMAYAHPQGHSLSLFNGFSHPWLGADHLLAMLAVGMLAATQAKIKVQLTLIFAFLISLTIGVYSSIPLSLMPSAEYLVASSVGLLGISLLFSRQLSRVALASIIISSGLLHGLVHGAEIPTNTASSSFIIGMLLASSALHFGGFIWLRWGTARALPYFQRASAVGLTLSSAFLLFSL
ncbi:HupE/UreJ family protein [Chitinibacter bivalviorum]|uniref:HupE/UreJ family protein n=1 Tax=Chitinibacter bivalviorum TaxID=2739434 RepID=A0A7H9BIX3_9NEIS|nr:HupE/UreJ family protein [Chitinibacter bivalviorum]QLG88429.1 HupE/UreJ family protein [Chitinibacter bivalviorum]